MLNLQTKHTTLREEQNNIYLFRTYYNVALIICVLNYVCKLKYSE